MLLNNSPVNWDMNWHLNMLDDLYWIRSLNLDWVRGWDMTKY